MQLLTVTHFFESHGGGIERVAGHLNRHFEKLGVRAVWAASSSDPAPSGDFRSIPLKCINPTERLTGLPMPIPTLGSMRVLINEVRKADAVIVHDALYATSILALLTAKFFRKPVIIIQHIAEIPFSSRALQFIMRLANALVTRPMLFAADVRVFISDAVRNDLLGSPARHSFNLLFNGVDSSTFRPGRRRREPGSYRTRTILFVGRYVEKKGLSVIRALAGARPDLRFVMVGTGPIQPTKWGLTNVRDIGAQDPKELAHLYQSVDVLLLPSVGEGYPLVVQEAMACGLPVICGEPSSRADPGAARWLRGVVIDLKDPDESADRCSKAIDNLNPTEDECTAMADYAARNYNWGTTAERLISLAQEAKKQA